MRNVQTRYFWMITLVALALVLAGLISPIHAREAKARKLKAPAVKVKDSSPAMAFNWPELATPVPAISYNSVSATSIQNSDGSLTISGTVQREITYEPQIDVIHWSETVYAPSGFMIDQTETSY